MQSRFASKLSYYIPIRANECCSGCYSDRSSHYQFTHFLHNSHLWLSPIVHLPAGQYYD
ncbi:hypothetical protein PAUR_b0902 [Pseudoalteromonas aurantia 208]|uniref:Uncharacterized protein n=1 Tax=Pseudoalteromonas aurantia 208 TaxID=1314867 RepID=A0ABR9EIK8_9GAMM|nr:hypothetical protein [Pseudoalteromonas aurantia 208]